MGLNSHRQNTARHDEAADVAGSALGCAQPGDADPGTDLPGRFGCLGGGNGVTAVRERMP